MNEDELVAAAHEQYKKLQSLPKTAEWLAEVYGVPWNRHRLSREFHVRGLHVNPPNGRPPTVYKIATAFESPYTKIATKIVKLAWRDIMDWLSGAPDARRIDWMSACYFVGTTFYDTCLSAIAGAAGNTDVSVDSLAVGVGIDDVRRGLRLYMAAYNRWVLGED